MLRPFAILLWAAAALPAQNYLAANQREDGCWAAGESGGVAEADLQTHAWAVLAHLGDGSCSASGPAHEQVARAVRWVHAQMDDEGRIGLRTDPSWALDQAMATYALVEDVRLCGAPDHPHAAASRLAAHALTERLRRQRPAVGVEARLWSSFVVMGLDKMARAAGETDRAAPWSTTSHGLQAALDGLPAPDEPSSLRERAAAALFADPNLRASERAAVELPPLPSDATSEPVASFYGVLLRYRRGGAIWTETSHWLKVQVVQSQQAAPTAHENRGSWEPGGAFGERHGRIGVTAVNVLSLEMYYRFCQLSAVGGP